MQTAIKHTLSTFKNNWEDVSKIKKSLWIGNKFLFICESSLVLDEKKKNEWLFWKKKLFASDCEDLKYSCMMRVAEEASDYIN